ncbi:MAG TPA: hypothetical protein VMV92_19715 [Streptosporangiaceae bacterium]|nr:hypothetical protein [Streptosporangiaceae bacterium]
MPDNAREDAVHEHQRPKLDRYSSHLFVTAYSVALDTGTGELAGCEVDAFVTSNALVTVRRGAASASWRRISRFAGTGST